MYLFTIVIFPIIANTFQEIAIREELSMLTSPFKRGSEMFVDHVTVFSQSMSHIRLSHTILCIVRCAIASITTL